jgi:hypothetical protein
VTPSHPDSALQYQPERIEAVAGCCALSIIATLSSGQCIVSNEWPQCAYEEGEVRVIRTSRRGVFMLQPCVLRCALLLTGSQASSPWFCDTVLPRI